MDTPPAPLRDHGLAALVRWMAPRRRRQLAGLFALMLAGAVAELVAVGAVVPFLKLVVAPAATVADPRLAALRAAFGWRDAGDLVVPAALVMIGGAVAAAAVRLLLTWASQRFVHQVSRDMDAGLFARTLRRPYLDQLAIGDGAVMAGFDKINLLANMLLLPVMNGVAAAGIAAAIVALLVWIDPFAASVTAVAASAIYAAIAMAARRSLARASADRARLATARLKAVGEGLGGFRDIVLDASQPFHERRFAAINAGYREAGARAAIVAAAPRYLVEGAGVALIGAVAIHLAGRPGGALAAVPVLGALVLGAQRLLPLLQAAYGGLVQYLAMRHSLADVLALLAASVAAGEPAGEAPPFREAIALEGVGFRYPDGTVALEGVDLVVPRGGRIGLVGRSGSGKSTLADLVMGLVAPTEGVVRVDGVALTPALAAAWRTRIAHVPQAVFVADDGVAANIAFGRPVDGKRVEAAARAARAHAFVEALPQGYDTMLGERGARLSGGQRQRIGIARALYRGAEILVLDEATGALDDETQGEVMAAIAALGREVTVIAIAHRLSSLAGCDTLVRLDEGRVVACGPPAAMGAAA